MDIFFFVGLLIAFGSVVASFLLEGGHLDSLLLLPPFIVVMGGSIGVTVISHKMGDIAGSFGALVKTFTGTNRVTPDKVIKRIVDIATVCRAEGLLRMQSLAEDPELSTSDYLVLKAGMTMAMDMKSADEIETALMADLEAFSAQRSLHVKVFSDAGGFAPTLGIIGTVMGLVHVLGNMEDPTKLVTSIAGAFLATLYGVGFANLLFLPCATRIKTMLKREMILKTMLVEGICMVVRAESPRSIENKLSMYHQAFPGGFKKYKAGIEK